MICVCVCVCGRGLEKKKNCDKRFKKEGNCLLWACGGWGRVWGWVALGFYIPLTKGKK